MAIRDHFQKPQIDLEAKNWVEGLKEVKKYFKKLNSNPASEHARDMVPHTPKHWFFHYNHVSGMLRS